MNRLGKERLAVAAIAFAAMLGTFAAYAAFAPAAPSKPLTPASIALLIEREGPQKAYAEFAERNANAPLREQHLAAHIVGEALYREAGVEGIRYCDAQFSFGCYHGFFGVALEEAGEAAIPELDAACVKAYGPWGTGCTHGIGHGILEYTGPDHLAEALLLCERTTQLSPYLGCTSGVFMEYNTPLVGSSQDALPTMRPLDPEHPYEPCLSIPAKNRASCFFELGSWYRAAGQDGDASGALCAALADADRTNCFLGVGASIPPTTSFDPSVALARCALYPSADERSCRAGAYWMFYANPEYRDRGTGVCRYTDSVLTESCETLADLTLGKLRK